MHPPPSPGRIVLVRMTSRIVTPAVITRCEPKSEMVNLFVFPTPEIGAMGAIRTAVPHSETPDDAGGPLPSWFWPPRL